MKAFTIDYIIQVFFTVFLVAISVLIVAYFGSIFGLAIWFW